MFSHFGNSKVFVRELYRLQVLSDSRCYYQFCLGRAVVVTVWKREQRLRPGALPWCELMQLLYILLLLLKSGCVSGKATLTCSPIPFSLFLICPNAVSNRRWWIKRAEQTGASRNELDTNKIHLSFSISLVITKNRSHSGRDPSMASAQHLLERTSLQSLAHVRLEQKTPSLPAWDHVAFGFNIFLE